MLRINAILAMCVLAGPALGAPEPTGEKHPSPDQALQKELRRFSISAPLDKALQQYQDLIGLRIETDWAALGDTGVTKDTTVPLKFSRATTEQLLDLTLAQVAKRGAPLAWCIEDGVIHITTQIKVLHRDRKLPEFSEAVTRPAPTRPATRRRTMLSELNFQNVGVKKVFDFFQHAAGLNMSVNWASLKLVGITPETPVKLKLKDVSLTRALEMVLAQLSAGREKLDGVYWILDRGVVTVATGAALNNRLIVHVYDIGDMLTVMPSIPAPSLDLRQEQSIERPTDRKEALAEDLVEAIKDTIGQDMWKPIGKGSINILRGKLIISQTPLGFKLMAESTR